MPDSVIVTASAGSFPGLADALRADAVTVEEVPLLTFAPPDDWSPVDAAATDLSRFAAVAFTSPRAGRAFVERVKVLRQSGVAEPEVWVAGAGTAVAVESVWPTVRRPSDCEVGERGAATALAGAMLAQGVRGPVLFPCGDRRRDELPHRLREAGVEVVEVVCYHSVLADEAAARRVVERARVLVVASPSVAELLARVSAGHPRPPLVAVGPTTDVAARRSGWPPDAVADRPTAGSLAARVRGLLVTP